VKPVNTIPNMAQKDVKTAPLENQLIIIPNRQYAYRVPAVHIQPMTAPPFATTVLPANITSNMNRAIVHHVQPVNTLRNYGHFPLARVKRVEPVDTNPKQAKVHVNHVQPASTMRILGQLPLLCVKHAPVANTLPRGHLRVKTAPLVNIKTKQAKVHVNRVPPVNTLRRLEQQLPVGVNHV
tara:strand:+ start:558 stop:1100 length:543 start_codon:yes stop_codon:yes gene_type:complete